MQNGIKSTGEKKLFFADNSQKCHLNWEEGVKIEVSRSIVNDILKLKFNNPENIVKEPLKK